MKSASWCFSLVLVFIAGSFGEPIAFAQSMEAEHGDSFVTASKIRNTALASQTAGATAATDTSTANADARVHPDSREVKQSGPPQESAPSPGKPKVSFWQWLNGKKVDCSSGACTFR